MMSVVTTTLSENSAGRVGLLAEWGLSILLEVDNLKILLDTGQTFSVVYNTVALGIDLSQIDKLVLSHGHRDHTGGLPYVLRQVRKEIEIIAHPDIWTAKYGRIFGEQAEYAEYPLSGN